MQNTLENFDFPKSIKNSASINIKTGTDIRIKNSINNFLKDLRELLYKESHISSRNEALEDLSKLLLCNIYLMNDNGRGINSVHPLKSDHIKYLVQNVQISFEAMLTPELFSSFNKNEFSLKCVGNNSKLALDIIIILFEKLNAELTIFKYEDIKKTEILNDIFGHFLVSSYSDEKELGQYLTPSEVVTFMVEQIYLSLSKDELSNLFSTTSSNSFGRIIDPSCGVGSFLIEFIKQGYKQLSELENEDFALNWVEKFAEKNILGIDKSHRMVKLCITNFIMHGFKSIHISASDGLSIETERVLKLKNSAKIIITNPPFGVEYSLNEIQNFNFIKETNSEKIGRTVSEVLFIDKYLDWLKDGGHLITVIPDSILTNKGVFESLRNYLRGKVEIISITSLPEMAFMSAGTNTKTSVMHLRKAEKNLSQHTKFFICNDLGFEVTTQNSLKKKVYKSTNELENSHFIKWKIVNNIIDSSRWDACFHASLPESINTLVQDFELYNLVKFSDVAELINDRNDPKKLFKDFFKYIEISDIDIDLGIAKSKLVECNEAPSRARKVVQQGDILMSTVRPDRKNLGIVQKEDDGAICSTGFAVIRPKNIDPYLLLTLLKDDFCNKQILRNNVGISYPTIEEKCLTDLILPIAKKDIVELSYYGEIQKKQNELDLLKNNIKGQIAKKIFHLNEIKVPKLHQ